MRAIVLTDNNACGELLGEWGLSILIETKNKKILLDAGATDVFAKNAQMLNADLTDVDLAVLSHAHYDHADGFETFFGFNKNAPLYLRDACGENCYDIKNGGMKYIGIQSGMLKKFEPRLKRMRGLNRLSEDVWLLPHTTKGLDRIGQRESMVLIDDHGQRVDEFDHEQSLVIDTKEGLVIFNSCSHGGADNIIREVGKAFPEKEIAAIVGGFHLYNKTEEEVRAFALRVKETGIRRLYTGHCTGESAFAILKEELGDKLYPLYAGLEMSFGE